MPRQSFENLRTALESRESAPSIVHVYPGAHHGFGAATRRAIEVNARAFAVSWPQTLAFITATAAESAP